jgi:Protein of unknown function (DUF1552)
MSSFFKRLRNVREATRNAEAPKTGLSRRHFLSGVGGAMVALPFLETFAPKQAAADGTDVSPFAIFCRQGNGVQQQTSDEPERFWPSFAAGPITTAMMTADSDRAVSELAAYAPKMNLVRGIKFAFPGNGCGHSGGGNQCMTAAQVSADPAGNLSLAMGESIDNKIQTDLDPGVEPLTLYVGTKYGYLDEVMSYRGAKQIRAAENNPYNVYKDLFGLSTIDPQALQTLQTRRKSVNDLVRGEMQALLSRSDLSMADHTRLDLHFQSIRDLEIGIVCGLSAGDVTNLEAQQANIANDDDFLTICKLHMDLIVLAMSCGSSRAATLQFGSGNTGTQFTLNGVKQLSYHKISHRIDSDGSVGNPIPNADLLHHQIDQLHGQLFKYLLDGLNAVQLANGTLLDSGVAVWLNDLTDKTHSYDHVPYILVGGAKGYLKTGQFIDMGTNRVTNNQILSTIGAAVGLKNGSGQPLDDFGDPSLTKGQIAQLIA